MPRLPLPQATIDPARVLASAARVRQALFAAPVFADDAAEFGVTEASLDARQTRPFPGQAKLWDWVEGSDHFRFAGLSLLTEAAGTNDQHVLRGDAHLSGGAQVVAGHLTIEGDLTVDGQGMLLVLGDLRLEGDLRMADMDYALVAARRMTLRHALSWGELIALEAIEARGDVYLAGNDFTYRAPRFAARTLVDFERSNVFLDVSVGRRVETWDFAEAAAALGVDADEGLAEGFLDSMKTR